MIKIPSLETMPKGLAFFLIYFRYMFIVVFPLACLPVFLVNPTAVS